MKMEIGIGMAIVCIIACVIFVIFAIYKMYIEEYIAKRRHIYITPKGLENNEEWNSLVEDWRELTKLNSWTEKHRRQEDNYKFGIRKFLKSGTDKSNFIDIPIVAVRLQTAKTLLDNYYNRSHNLDWKKAITDSGYIHDVLSSGDIPDDVKSVVREINDAYYSYDDEGVDFASQQLMKVHIKIVYMNR